jgi:hypothetical protein
MKESDYKGSTNEQTLIDLAKTAKSIDANAIGRNSLI